MKKIITTSNKHLHLIPVFEYLYMKYWGDLNIEIVGYEKPNTNLPFVSLGTQGTVKEWSTDLRKYFEKQDQFFIWMFDDTFLTSPISKENYTYPLNIGRFDLSCDIMKREYTSDGVRAFAHPEARYRLSTQPSIWNKDFLLQYLTDGMDPWTFETQDPKNDGWEVSSMLFKLIHHNEGVRRFDIYKLNLDGMEQEDIDYINTITPWQTK